MKEESVTSLMINDEIIKPIDELIGELRALGAEVRVVRNREAGARLGDPWVCARWNNLERGVDAERLRGRLVQLSARIGHHAHVGWKERRVEGGLRYDLEFSWFPPWRHDAIPVLNARVDHITPNFVQEPVVEEGADG